MTDLIDYIEYAVERGECQCGQCFDSSNHPKENQPSGHTSDLVFFKVKQRKPVSIEQLKNLIKDFPSQWNECNLFDGQEHSYIEVGGWIGSQSHALMLMGLGEIVGLWELLTPKNMLPPGMSEDVYMQLAQNGMITIKMKNDSNN